MGIGTSFLTKPLPRTKLTCFALGDTLNNDSPILLLVVLAVSNLVLELFVSPPNIHFLLVEPWNFLQPTLMITSGTPYASHRLVKD